MSYPFPGSRAQMTSAAMMKEHQLRKSDQESVSTASKGLISLSLIQSLTALIVIGFGIYRLLMVCNNGNLATGAWVGCTVMSSGILGIVAGLSREEKPLSSFLVTSLLAVILSLVLIVMESLGLSTEIQNCNTATIPCQPGCLVGSTVLVLLGLFHLCLGGALAFLSTRITRKNTNTDNMIMPLWAIPSSSGYYRDFYLSNHPRSTINEKRGTKPGLPAIQEHDQDVEPQDESTTSQGRQTSDDKFVFP